MISIYANAQRVAFAPSKTSGLLHYVTVKWINLSPVARGSATACLCYCHIGTWSTRRIDVQRLTAWRTVATRSDCQAHFSRSRDTPAWVMMTSYSDTTLLYRSANMPQTHITSCLLHAFNFHIQSALRECNILFTRQSCKLDERTTTWLYESARRPLVEPASSCKHGRPIG